MSILKVLIADDHRLFRQGLIGLMKTRRDLVEVVGEAATGTETLELAEQLNPDVVLLDLQMPDGDGFQTATFLHQFYPQLAIVILTASESDEDLYQAVQLGVSGYLLKSLDAAELFDLLGSVAQGEMALTRAMASRLVRSIARHNSTTDANGSPMTALTERELDVLRLVAQGASNPQIADTLCITVNTVKVHLHNILEKLQLKNRAQVAAYAVSRGLTTAPGNMA